MFSFDEITKVDPEVAAAMTDEFNRQNNNLELIASENIVSKAVMAAMGSHLTNKYAEDILVRDITVDVSMWMLLRTLREREPRSCLAVSM